MCPAKSGPYQWQLAITWWNIENRSSRFDFKLHVTSNVWKPFESSPHSCVWVCASINQPLTRCVFFMLWTVQCLKTDIFKSLSTTRTSGLLWRNFLLSKVNEQNNQSIWKKKQVKNIFIIEFFCIKFNKKELNAKSTEAVRGAGIYVSSKNLDLYVSIFNVEVFWK